MFHCVDDASHKEILESNFTNILRGKVLTFVNPKPRSTEIVVSYCEVEILDECFLIIADCAPIFETMVSENKRNSACLISFWLEADHGRFLIRFSELTCKSSIPTGLLELSSSFLQIYFGTSLSVAHVLLIILNS